MFGKHTISETIKEDRLLIELQSHKNGIRYRRTIENAVEEKMVLGSPKNFRISPVEPFNTPKAIVRHLMIRGQEPVLVEPKGQADIYLTFPLEIGVFLDRGEPEMIDVFSLVPQRFSLYGDPRTGILCRYWQSPVLNEPGKPRPFYEGLLQLRIKNSSGGWVRMSRVIIDAVSMKIYYNDEMVGLKGQVNLLSRTTAEMWCRDSPLKEGMKKADELFEGKKLALGEHKFVMSEGL